MIIPTLESMSREVPNNLDLIMGGTLACLKYMYLKILWYYLLIPNGHMFNILGSFFIRFLSVSMSSALLSGISFSSSRADMMRSSLNVQTYGASFDLSAIFKNLKDIINYHRFMHLPDRNIANTYCFWLFGFLVVLFARHKTKHFKLPNNTSTLADNLIITVLVIQKANYVD